MEINVTCKPLAPEHGGPQDPTEFKAVLTGRKRSGPIEAEVAMDLGDHAVTLETLASALERMSSKLRDKAEAVRSR